MTYKTPFILLTFLILPSLVFAQKLHSIRFLPQWLPQAQFAGFYMAKEKGIYAKYGLDVEILKGGPIHPVQKVLNDGGTDFISMFLSGGIKSRSFGNNIVLVGQLSQMSALTFVARKDAGIHSLQDFNGRKIGIWRSDFQEIPIAFLLENKIEYELVPITNTINLFLKGGIDIMCVMWYNEFHQILNAGIDEEELTVIHFFENNFNIPEDGIYCTEDFYLNNTEVCRKFVKATLEGWWYAFEHEEETLDEVIRLMVEARVPANKAHQRWMLARMEDVMMPGGQKTDGEIKYQQFIRTAGILLNSETIQEIPRWVSFNRTQTK